MKNQSKNLFLLFLSLGMMTSCSKSEDAAPLKTIEELQPVKYDIVANKTLSSISTGNIIFNPATNSNQYEYLTTVEKQESLEPLSLISISNSDVIYPGSILRGSSFLNNTYDPLVLKNAFNKVVLSGTLQGGLTNFTADVSPNLSGMRAAINQLKSDNKANVDYSAVPAVFEYESTEIYNEQSFKKALDVHVDLDILGGLVSAKFGYNANSGSASSSKHTLVKMRQWFYNFAIDPKYYADWVNGPIDANECGTHEPVYVSSVDYGRIAFIDIQNNNSSEYNSLMIQASVKVALTAVSGSADVNYSNEFKALITNNKVKFMVVGGPAQLAQQISDYASFVAFIQRPTTSELVSSSVPISYKVRRLKDNTQVLVKDIFASQYKELKAN